MEERKFVCKYCNKKYPCGKSLGGHIRTHMTNKFKTNVGDSVVKFDGGRKRKRDFGSDEEEETASEKPIYDLKENPKKTTKKKKKIVIIPKASSIQKERFCKECGKGFLSLKALCGHMACHSEKDKGTMKNKFENNSGFGVKQKMVMMMDSESDTETLSAPNYPRRSRSMRFKTVNTDTNGSSSVSDVEQEQEEVAKCLMLLSKDTGIIFKNGKRSVRSNGVEIVEEEEEERVVLYKNMKLKSGEIVDSDNSDSGFFRNGPKMLNLDVPIDKHLRNREFKTPKVEDRSEYKNKVLIKNRGRTRITEPKKLTLEDLDYDTTDGFTREEIINWRKRPSYNSLCQNNPIGVSCKKTPNGFHTEGSWKRESLNSEKVIISGSYDDDDDSSAYDESDESSTDTDAYPAQISNRVNAKKISKCKKKLESKKSRDHRCPICYKMFKSGQALGGHKRSHFVGGSEENTLVIKQDSPVVQCLIDLNLPAPVDD
ncbi:hypothetical protein K1719_017119 [Acacia pycnantha]|nr:hypothetical protein K1719_017119 [Acacia pycnantha]